MNQRYFIHLAYKGSRYFGWQIQPSHPSVQQEIETALTKLNSNKKIEIIGCGRTDTGVHAENYFAHFDSEKLLDTDQLKFKLNQILPEDIAIKSVFLVAPEWHARYSAISRTYHYRLHHEKNPFLAETSWQFRQQLDLSKINQACNLIKNHEDFECFSKVNTDVGHFNCTIHHVQWKKTEQGYLFEVSANRFLRNMVRAMTGTLIDVGLSKISLKDVEHILNSKNRSLAGTSVPAHGLTLMDIKYPKSAF